MYYAQTIQVHIDQIRSTMQKAIQHGHIKEAKSYSKDIIALSKKKKLYLENFQVTAKFKAQLLNGVMFPINDTNQSYYQYLDFISKCKEIKQHPAVKIRRESSNQQVEKVMLDTELVLQEVIEESGIKLVYYGNMVMLQAKIASFADGETNKDIFQIELYRRVDHVYHINTDKSNGRILRAFNRAKKYNKIEKSNLLNPSFYAKNIGSALKFIDWNHFTGKFNFNKTVRRFAISSHSIEQPQYNDYLNKRYIRDLCGITQYLKKAGHIVMRVNLDALVGLDDSHDEIVVILHLFKHLQDCKKSFNMHSVSQCHVGLQLINHNNDHLALHAFIKHIKKYISNVPFVKVEYKDRTQDHQIF